jgi:hypothetical protein
VYQRLGTSLAAGEWLLIAAILLVRLMRVDDQLIDWLVLVSTLDKAEFALPKRLQLSNAVQRDRIEQSIGEIAG